MVDFATTDADIQLCSYCKFRKRLIALAPYIVYFFAFLFMVLSCIKLMQPVAFDTVSCVIATLFHLHVM